jgi:hypothetical protein
MSLSYYKSKWSLAELDGKKVEFVLTSLTHCKKGFGTFQIHRFHELISIVISEPHLSAGHDHLYPIFSADLADKIEPHPDKSVADFRLLA